MAKDPAFLFYPGDWLGGTMHMTIEQKGAYMELLVFQFNNGPFSQSQAKQVLSMCFASVWQVVSKKFTLDASTGLYSNARLTLEVDKRRKFSESRRNNAKSDKHKSLAYAKHMENENENRNVNINNGDIVKIGNPEGPFIAVKRKYAYEKSYVIYGVDGLKEYLETSVPPSRLTFPEMAPKFMRAKDGHHFDDLEHVKNAYDLFVKNQYQ